MQLRNALPGQLLLCSELPSWPVDSTLKLPIIFIKYDANAGLVYVLTSAGEIQLLYDLRPVKLISNYESYAWVIDHAK